MAAAPLGTDSERGWSGDANLLGGHIPAAFTKLNAWRQVPMFDIAFMALVFPINVLALVYLVYRYAWVHRSERLE